MDRSNLPRACFFLLASLLASVLVGCGGKVVVEAGEAGGDGGGPVRGTGGEGGIGGTASSTGGGHTNIASTSVSTTGTATSTASSGAGGANYACRAACCTCGEWFTAAADQQTLPPQTGGTPLCS